MSYFPSDIPYMSEKELLENGIKIPKIEPYLKPCPFCGSKDVKIYSYSDGGICVKCLDCYCQTHVCSDYNIVGAKKQSAYETVVEAWNRRVTE